MLVQTRRWCSEEKDSSGRESTPSSSHGCLARMAAAWSTHKSQEGPQRPQETCNHTSSVLGVTLRTSALGYKMPALHALEELHIAFCAPCMVWYGMVAIQLHFDGLIEPDISCTFPLQPRLGEWQWQWQWWCWGCYLLNTCSPGPSFNNEGNKGPDRSSVLPTTNSWPLTMLELCLLGQDLFIILCCYYVNVQMRI